MRIAVLVLGLLLGFIFFLQTILGGLAGSLGDNEELSGAAAVGFLSALLWFVGSALVVAFPLFSAAIFLFTAIILLPAGITSEFKDLIIWSVIAAFLALMSFFGWRGKKRDRREAQREKLQRQESESRMHAMMMHAGTLSQAVAIDARKVDPSSKRSSQWRFVAIEASGNIIATSEPFKAERDSVPQRDEAHRQFQLFLTTLRNAGWNPLYQPTQEKNPDWFKWQLGRSASTPSS